MSSSAKVTVPGCLNGAEVPTPALLRGFFTADGQWGCGSAAWFDPAAGGESA